MSKRSGASEMEGPSAKMKREDPDDGGGRTGRVRKKSAKVLEMEEFEQVEKTHHSGKKSKTPKLGAGVKMEEDIPSAQSIVTELATPKIKIKAPKAPAVTPKSTLAANLMQAPISVTPALPKSVKSGSVLGAQLNKPVSQFVPVQTSGILTTTVKQSENATDILAAVIKKEFHDDTQDDSEEAAVSPVAIKSEQPQSVIKYLLSSPASGSKTSVGVIESGTELVGGGGKKSTSKKAKFVQEKAAKAAKAKTAKQKLEMSSPNEGDDEEDEDGNGSMASLKMRISASSDPQTAQVTLNPKMDTPGGAEKTKKKKSKTMGALESPESASALKMEPEEPGSPTSKKGAKKSSKKKEKLIQEAISAANKLPAQELHEVGKPIKKKKKMNVADEPSPGESAEGDLFIDEAEGESNLVIAETEKKKKKSLRKKKPSLKGQSDSKDDEKEKKLSKRAPTAYMLFCNTHRPGIVNQNPGIEFAGISKKLGEMWQTLSTKQKLQWRRKAQRRMKKGSNLISTGKAVLSKDAAMQGSNISLLQPAGASAPAASSTQAASGVRYINIVNRSPVENPQSPTKTQEVSDDDNDADISNSTPSWNGTEVLCGKNVEEDTNEITKCTSYLRKAFERVTVAGDAKIEGKRNYRKPDYCLFCKTMYGSKISNHYMKTHAKERRVQEIANIPRHSKERKRLLTLLQNDGNHLHNCMVLQRGCGELTVCRRPSHKDGASAENYLPCVVCKAWIFKRNLSLHSNKCPSNISTNNNLLRNSEMLLSPFLNFDNEDEEIEDIFLKMKDTVKYPGLKTICQQDSLITEFCRGLVHKLGFKGEQRRKDKDNIRTKARAVARLLVGLNEKTNKSLSLDEYIKPETFMLTVNTVKDMGLHFPNLALNLGHYINQICQLKKSVALQIEDEFKRKEAEDFEMLYQAHWNNYVSAVSPQRQKLRSLNKSLQLPDQ